MPANDETFVRVGELAASAGLTVRALHHYEEIGLLTPSSRTDAGHRMYGPDMVERLYRVCLLRRFGLSLNQIRLALDDPEWGLQPSLRRHVASLSAQVSRLDRLRAVLDAALADLDRESDPTIDLLPVLEEMIMADTPLRRRISILVYQDLRAAHAYLVDVFGMTPGEITETPDGDIVHAQVFAGDGEIWLHPETEQFGLASPSSLGAATATMAVMVENVDEHYELVRAKGADIVYSPADQPYGYREYGARDLEGGLWSFMKEIEP